MIYGEGRADKVQYKAGQSEDADCNSAVDRDRNEKNAQVKINETKRKYEKET